MVLVFHWTFRLSLRKIAYFIILTTFLLFLHTFEISYHFFKSCPDEDKIDVVYTWVNGSDPLFIKQLGSYLLKFELDRVDSSFQRFDDKNELKFSLRSLEKYAPWVNHVYIVTNGQIPYWLNLDYEKVTLVMHKDIFIDEFDLPSFSSPAIEAHLHRIPNLSSRFIYFNDDIFLKAPTFPSDFYSPNRGFLIYLSWLLPPCAPGCYWLYVADGHCDEPCDNPKCQNDGGDCDDASSKPVLGDIIVKFDDYEFPEQETNKKYDKILSELQNTTSIIEHLQKRSASGSNPLVVEKIISEHNSKVLMRDKLKRRKVKRRLSKFLPKKVRSNVDAYAESLQHTNRILNEFYGYSLRKVPAHAPIMIDKDIMKEMHKKFQRFFVKTARNKIRSIDDVQFAFSYYYYIIHEKVELGIEEIFDQFDTDRSQIWSDSEIRTLIAKLYDLPITDEVFSHFTHLIVNCSSVSMLPNLIITKEFIRDCSSLSFFIKSSLSIKHKYKFELIKDAEKKHVSFKMLNSNVSEVVKQLDDLRKHEKKFVCLNDNLDQSHFDDNEVIKRLMLDFYTTLFPDSSKFELPAQLRNRFLHMDDYLALLEKQKRRFLLSCLFLFVIIVVLFINFFRRKLCEFVDRIFC